MMLHRAISTASIDSDQDDSKEDSLDSTSDDVPGCACKHCVRHPKVYSAIILSMGLSLFIAILICIFYYQAFEIWEWLPENSTAGTRISISPKKHYMERKLGPENEIMAENKTHQR
ncbi:uncharacterized protein LOC109534646 [Dendroctonus ponderosae]|uniref:Uncharacterized protein n=1 Tax=Dendroctonus ponderosae TaxID=77166 RepID=A0AAR5P4A0_DENPD|nr:uncharacterized protein LOC109534646 [Dendroctonus ponderosae]KAH1005671.1 hypothetical protein HUJ04_006610 [Dendroctonus ponderosae]KAH1012781.1 hypothetical protein HUJ05_011877 [Dendroctonus ponderosae]